MKAKATKSFLLALLIASSVVITATATQTKTTAATKTVSQTNDSSKKTSYKYQSHDLKITSRKTKIPVTVVMPEVAKGETVPLVVMAHGHGGSRNENGGFTAIAEELAKSGIASVRMDFPGCGDSTESFKNNTLSNMMLDIKNSRDYAQKNYAIDSKKISILGYSMGGRLAMMTAGKDPSYNSALLLAPACDLGENLLTSIGGDKTASLSAEASKNGYANYTTQYGQKQQLSKAWFDDIRSSTPLADFAGYAGDVLVLYGTLDTVVDLPNCLAAAGAVVNSAKSVKTYEVKGADHGYGFYDEKQAAIKADVVAQCGTFFSNTLLTK